MKEKIKKLLLSSTFIIAITTKTMDDASSPLEREKSYRTALLGYCKGKEKKIQKKIKESQKNNKCCSIILSDRDTSIQLTALPFQKKVYLNGPGYLATEMSFNEFLQQIAIPQDTRQAKSKRKCAIQ